MLLQVIKHVCFFCVVLQIDEHLDVVTKQVWVPHERKTSKKRMKKECTCTTPVHVPGTTCTFMMCTAVYMYVYVTVVVCTQLLEFICTIYYFHIF